MTTFYPGGQSLPVNGYGQVEGRQHLVALRNQGRAPCPGKGCPAYEKGWTIEVNTADPEDVNVARYIREGKTGLRFAEALLMQGVIQFHFLAEQFCLGHKVDWDDPTYIVGQRKATPDEYINRLGEGIEAINHANTRGL